MSMDLVFDWILEGFDGCSSNVIIFILVFNFLYMVVLYLINCDWRFFVVVKNDCYDKILFYD